jgi:CRP-like cAMP-binding protein
MIRTLNSYIQSITPLSDNSWKLLQSCITERSYKKAELLLKEGQVCQSIFFIEEGACKSFHNLDGKEINTAFHFENDFATNIQSLTKQQPASSSIKALEKTRVVILNKNKLLAAYSASHEIESFGRKVLELLLTRQTLHTESFKLLKPKQRFDHLVATQPDLLQRVSLTQVASYLGISRESLSRFRSAR